MMYLTRNKIYAKLETDKEAKKVYIFCEGNVTEIDYFKYFQGFSSNIDIIPIPSLNDKSDPVKLKENAQLIFEGSETVSPKYRLSPDYQDEVWFVIDTDRWNEGDKIQQLKNYCAENNKKYNGWFVAQSNPSFEIWLYYHFHAAKPTDSDVAKSASFKEFVHKTLKGGFDNRKMPIEIQTAIKNSIQNLKMQGDQPDLYSTEVHNVGKVIVRFVKQQLDKCIEFSK